MGIKGIEILHETIPHTQTMAAKVWLSLERSGLNHEQVVNAVNQMFKDGIIVPERRD